MSEDSSAELAVFVSSVKEALGSILIGSPLQLLLQTYLYFRYYPLDPILLKLMVTTFFVLDTFTTVLVSHSLYVYLVFNAADISRDAFIPWSFILESEIVDIITLMAQSYFAYQLLHVGIHKVLPVTVFVLALGAFAVDIKVTYLMFKDFTVAVLASPDLYVYGSTSQGLAALCDIVITASLIYFLHSARSGVHSTGVLIDNLILYAVTRGTLTAICQLMFMTLNVAFPDHTYWQPFHQAVGKPYVNSVLASLNFRIVHEGSRKALPLRGSTAPTDLGFDSDGAANGSNADTEMNASKNTKQVLSFPTGLGTSTSTRIAERKDYSPS
ncbi:hypothetical protein BDZ89DRAFT_1163172 [Hymenopellis radicata]|nr:hypothetical protein BDZ89DRAFT_1163172 [Hymenopellis radicata]